MTITEALVRLGDLFKTSMQNMVPNKTGALKNSINYKVIEQPGVHELQRSMLTYGNYVDSGMKGTKSSFAPSSKSFLPMGQFKSPIISKQSGLPLPVRISIAEHGFRPQPFIQPSLDTVLQTQGMELLSKASVDTIQLSIQGQLQDIKIKG